VRSHVDNTKGIVNILKKDKKIYLAISWKGIYITNSYHRVTECNKPRRTTRSFIDTWVLLYPILGTYLHSKYMYWSLLWGVPSWDPCHFGILPFHGSPWSLVPSCLHLGSMDHLHVPIVPLWEPWIISRSSSCSFEHAPLASFLWSPFPVSSWGIISLIYPSYHKRVWYNGNPLLSDSPPLPRSSSRRYIRASLSF